MKRMSALLKTEVELKQDSKVRLNYFIDNYELGHTLCYLSLT